MTSVFVSHAVEDEAIAILLKEFLEQIFLNIDVFVSGRDLAGGEVWCQELRATLGEAAAIVSLVSLYSVNNRWVYFESGAGFVEGKTVPIILDDVDVSELNPPFSLLQSRRFDGLGVQGLVKDIAVRSKVRVPVRYPGLDALIDSVVEFISVRNESDDIDGMVAVSVSREYDVSIGSRVESLLVMAKDGLRAAIISRRGVFDLPDDEELVGMGLLDLEKIAVDVGVDVPFLMANRLMSSSMTVPYSSDPKWKKVSYGKHIDDLEVIVKRFCRGVRGEVSE